MVVRRLRDVELVGSAAQDPVDGATILEGGPRPRTEPPYSYVTRIRRNLHRPATADPMLSSELPLHAESLTRN